MRGMETYVLQMTARAMGAIGVIRIWGEEAAKVVDSVMAKTGAGTMAVGKVRRVRVGKPTVIDDAVLIKLGEGEFELHTHGGIAVMAAVLAALKEAGAEIVETERAIALGMLGGVLEAEMLAMMARAVTETGLRLLANQPSALGAWVVGWEKFLGEAGNSQKLWQFQSAAQWVLERSAVLMRLFEPARIAIIGPPNVGKSTLANALLGRTLSITADLPGTTRDWVDARAVLTLGPLSIPVTLVDTAGIRPTPDAIEAEAIVRTHGQAEQADLLLILWDVSRPLSGEEKGLRARFAGRPTVLVAGKADLAAAWNLPEAVCISAKKLSGLKELMVRIFEVLELERVDTMEVVLFTRRQGELMRRAAEAATAEAARGHLAEIVQRDAAACEGAKDE